MRYIKKKLADFIIYITGWEFKGKRPSADKCILVGAPHTSNWDFFYYLLSSWHYNINSRWIGKEKLFSIPLFATICKILGGIPVERRYRDNAVARLSQAIKSSPEPIYLVIAPEGTRKSQKGWKSGFYYIAKEANVPIALGFVDYKTKTLGFLGEVTPSGDIDGDMLKIAALYQGISGKYPNKSSPIKVYRQQQN